MILNGWFGTKPRHRRDPRIILSYMSNLWPTDSDNNSYYYHGTSGHSVFKLELTSCNVRMWIYWIAVYFLFYLLVLTTNLIYIWTFLQRTKNIGHNKFNIIFLKCLRIYLLWWWFIFFFRYCTFSPFICHVHAMSTSNRKYWDI